MTRIVSPPLSETDKLRQPLEEGERRVLEFFHRNLPVAWEIYIQPHLNGLRPDFVLLNPKIGIAVFEVKNWDMGAMERWVEKTEVGPPVLMGRRDGATFSLQHENPVEKIYRYREQIRNLYCPRLAGNNGIAVITAGLIFPSADDESVSEKLFKESRDYRGMNENEHLAYYPIAGREALNNGRLDIVFPEAVRRRSYYMNHTLAQDLRHWLVEPYADQEQRKPLELDERQRGLATSRTKSGYRRVSGPAGSGKSLVVAARAATLICEGKDVLVTTFNITFLNYLADAAVRHCRSARKNGTWLHFHEWCRRICDDSGHGEDYTEVMSSAEPFETKDERLVELVSEIIDGNDNESCPRYDAILVDEGQDFRPEWWQLLRKVIKQGGEMLLAADVTQDVYGRAQSWTEVAMRGAGFTGDWTRLNISYRLPPSLVPHVREFGSRYLPKETLDLPDTIQLALNIDEYPCYLAWIQTDSVALIGEVMKAIDSILIRKEASKLAVSDVTVIVDNQMIGREIVVRLNARNIKVIDTFDGSDDDNLSANNEGRRKKLGFFLGDARVKVTTLHSFKGWEARAIIICVGYNNINVAHPLLYAGLTRLKRNQDGSFLTVVSADLNLENYGQSWPDFKQAYHSTGVTSAQE